MLGEGAIALHRAAYALDAVRTRLTAFGERLFESAERTQPVDDLRRLTGEMEALAEEFAEDLGREHEAVAAFGSARGAVQDVIQTLDLFKGPAPEGAVGVPTSPEDALDRIEAQRDDFDASRERFMEAVRASRQD